MLVEKIKEISGERNLQFNYGAEYWQNLQDLKDDTDLDFDERQKYLLLLWKDRDLTLSEYSAIIGYQFEGEMILCVRSRIDDPDYNFKYEKNVSKLEALSTNILSGFSICSNWQVESWHETEVINQYDTNIDGLKIRFTVIYNNEI